MFKRVCNCVCGCMCVRATVCECVFVCAAGVNPDSDPGFLPVHLDADSRRF